MQLSLDFETRSRVNLRTHGLHRYASDESTDLLCLAYAVDDEAVRLWFPGDRVPEVIVEAAADPFTKFRSFNAAFERTIWSAVAAERYRFPRIANFQWVCTQAEAMLLGLPRSLEYCAIALGLEVHKDMAGQRAMLTLTKPLDDGTFVTDPELLRVCGEYCRQDVVVEREVARRVRRQSSTERAVWQLDQTINQRGIRIDRPLVTAARAIAEQGIARANVEIAAATNGEIEKLTQTQRIREWLIARGIDAPDLTKDTVTLLLAGDVPPAARRVLQARQDGNRSSVAKLDTMLRYAGEDDRVRGQFVYAGAHTGRFAGNGVQLQNLFKATIRDIEWFIPSVLEGSYETVDAIAPPVEVIASLLRGCFIPDDGHTFLVGDFSQIEARITAWIAGEERLLNAFREGRDPYRELAARVYRTDPAAVTSGQRFIGKSLVLGAGFGLGAAGFAKRMEKEGVVLTPEEATQYIGEYRDAYPAIPAFWHLLRRASVTAMQFPNLSVRVGRVAFLRDGADGRLYLILPSGRSICYLSPRLALDKYDNAVVTTRQIDDTFENQMVPKVLWHGALMENAVQAIARDVLVAAMLRLDRDFPIVLHAHDEIVSEVPADQWPRLQDFLQLMSQTPTWADGLPIKTEGWQGRRYRK